MNKLETGTARTIAAQGTTSGSSHHLSMANAPPQTDGHVPHRATWRQASASTLAAPIVLHHTGAEAACCIRSPYCMHPEPAKNDFLIAYSNILLAFRKSEKKAICTNKKIYNSSGPFKQWHYASGRPFYWPLQLINRMSS